MSSPSIFRQNKQLSEISTFGIGGMAHYFAEVRSSDEMALAIKECRLNNYPYIVIGKGSNCLFDDRGFNGAVILNKIDFFKTLPNGIFHVGAGYSFSLFGVQTARQGWAGLEFASGIPASIGGAVFMNAGANGGETCDFLESVDFVDENGVIQLIKKHELEFGYRFSSFQRMKGAITGATFALKRSEEARQRQIEIIHYRTKTQPYGEKSAGCVFRNPKGGHAGALIEQSGLKGLSVGGAKVSEKHANFIINSKNAASSDILKLIDEIKKQVKEKTNVELESEIRLIPYDQGD